MNVNLAASIAHAHAWGVHSLVLEVGPPMVRLFYADYDHDLWRNEPSLSRDLICFKNTMSVAVHSHRQNIAMVPILGIVINVMFDHEQRSGARGVEGLFAFGYQSHIISGKGEFVRRPNQDIWCSEVTYLTRAHCLNARDLHTVFVPKHERAAWLILEGERDAAYDPTCYSNDDLTKFDFSALYKPMTPELASRIITTCEANSRHFKAAVEQALAQASRSVSAEPSPAANRTAATEPARGQSQDA